MDSPTWEEAAKWITPSMSSAWNRVSRAPLSRMSS